MPGQGSRLPPGFDPRTDLLLDFGLGEDGREVVGLRGAIEREPEMLREDGKRIDRLPETHAADLRRWLDGADDPRRLVVLQNGTRAAYEAWEAALPAVAEGKIRLVRCFPDLPVPAPKPPSPELRALIVIGDPRQGEGIAGAATDVASLVGGLMEALLKSGIGSVTVAANARWRSSARGAFAEYQGREELLLILRAGWDVVHVVAHGDPPDDDAHPFIEAGTLRLEDDPDGLPFEDLASVLSDGQTQLLTIQACWGGPRMAETLLSVIPHVILFRGAVHPGFSSRWSRHLYRGLFRDRLAVADAVAAARENCPDGGSWIPAHFAADLARRVVHDEEDYLRERYLRAVRGRHANLGGLVLESFGAGDHLEELYVELHLEEREEHPLPLDLGMRHPGPFTLHGLLDLSRVHRVTGRWVLAGHPGTGKSTSLRALACQLALERRFVPILISLPDWPRNEETRRLEPFATGLAGFLAHYPPPDGGPRVVLIDGLDECRDPDAAILDFLTGIEAARVVVATRKLHFEGRIPAGYWRVDLRELDPSEQVDLVTKWFRAHARRFPAAWSSRTVEREAQDLLGGLRGSLARSARTPFFLSLLALMRAGRHGPSRDASRREVLQEALRILILGEHRHGTDVRRLRYVGGVQDEVEAEEKAEAYERVSGVLLRWVAFHATVEGQGSFQDRHLDGWLKGSGEYPRRFLTTYTVPDSGLLSTRRVTMQQGVRTVYAFAHRVLREALTAEHLANVYAADGLLGLMLFVQEHLDPGPPELINEWGEPLALLTGWLEEQDQEPWVAFLMERDKGLSLRVLANAELAPALTARIFLAGPENDHERMDFWDQYEALLETEDPSDALVLVEQLLEAGSPATSRPHLARLDDLLRELGERGELSGDVRCRVEALRERPLEFVCQDLPDDRTLRKLFLELPQGSAPGAQNRDLWSQFIGPGAFEMGSPEEDEMRQSGEGPVVDEGPVPVTLTRAFQLARVVVTRAQYRVFDPEKQFDSERPGNDGEFPATNVNWYEACFFALFLQRVLRRLLGCADLVVRLPSEAEWEFACREAGAKATRRDAEGRVLEWWRYHSGNSEEDLGRVANFGAGKLEPVGRRKPNALELYDMHGNIWEWCSDWNWYGRKLAGGPDPLGPRTRPPSYDAGRVLRGGSFRDDARLCRSAFRLYFIPNLSYSFGGFRVVLAPRPPAR